MEVNVERVVGHGLYKRAGAAGPLLLIEDLVCDGRVSGIVRIIAIGVWEFDSENRVEKDAFEVVAVAGVLWVCGEAREVTGKLDGSIGATGGLEVIDRRRERSV